MDKEESDEQKTPAVGNANDAVRLYLREMGSITLLTRGWGGRTRQENRGR